MLDVDFNSNSIHKLSSDSFSNFRISGSPMPTYWIPEEIPGGVARSLAPGWRGAKSQEHSPADCLLEESGQDGNSLKLRVLRSHSCAFILVRNLRDIDRKLRTQILPASSFCKCVNYTRMSCLQSSNFHMRSPDIWSG